MRWIILLLLLGACTTAEPTLPPVDDVDWTLCEDPRPELCTMDYTPVCGAVQVECITEPCEPVEETFSNGCSACSNSRVLKFRPGEC